MMGRVRELEPGSLVATFPESSSFPSLDLAATQAKYEITFFVFSVFPAPDSPL